MFIKALRSKIIFIILAATTASSFLFCSEYFRRNEPREKAEQAELWNALETGNVNFAVELLRAGANPNTRGRDYLTVLEYAAHKGYKEVVEELLNSEIPLGTEQEFSAFNQAIIGGQLEIAQLLLDGGVDPNVQDDTLHNTPLMVAAMFNKLEIARLLLERGADTMLTNFIGQTALQLARESNNKAMIALIEGFNQQRMSE